VDERAGGALAASPAQAREQAARRPPDRVQARDPGIKAHLAGVHPCRPSRKARAGSPAGDPAPKANRKGIQRAGDARDFDRQVAEFQVRVAVLNGFTALGIPVTEVVG